MTNNPPAAALEYALTWARVEDGFYVASHDGVLVGFIDRVDHVSFQVCNASSQQIGFFKNLESAMSCLTRLSTTADSDTASVNAHGKTSVRDES